MAHLFEQTFTRRVPEGAEIFTADGERIAKWTDGNWGLDYAIIV